MAGIAQLLSFLWPEYFPDIISKSASHIQYLAFPCGFVVSYSGFNKMPRAVELMIFSQVGPAGFRPGHREVGIEVAVGLLGRGDQVDHFICCLFQIGVIFFSQNIGHRFQPFVNIAVLEDHPIELALGLTCSDAEVFQGMTGFSTFDLIVHNPVLIGDHHISH